MLIRLFTADEAHSSVPVNLSFTCERWFDASEEDNGTTVQRFFPDEQFQPETRKRRFTITSVPEVSLLNRGL